MILLNVIGTIIDFVTLRSLWKKKPQEIERSIADAYAQSDESKKLDEVTRVAGNTESKGRAGE